MNRDSIDFGKDKIGYLFGKILVPILLGMLAISAVTAIDGIFIGHGVGGMGIAAVNICVPIIMIFTGFGLMLGVGCSVVAAIHLSKDNLKAARINTTQALICATIVTLLASVFILLFPSKVAYWLGASELLVPFVEDYLIGFIPGLTLNLWCIIGLFIIRLDGRPMLAMWCDVISGLANIVLDWLFIFPLGMGVLGAAIATAISVSIGGLIVLVYLLGYANRLNLYRLKTTVKSWRLSMRNLGYQSKIGSSALLGELTMAVLMFTGNMVFMQYMGENGVGAFGIACYYCPFVFMVGGAIAQSAQPIISYNISSSHDRAIKTQRLALATSLVSGLLVTMAFQFFSGELVGLFLNPGEPSRDIAIHGMPLFSLGFTFFILNLTAIGYYQSVERVVPATVYALMRGLLILVPAFVIMPMLLGNNGVWLAMPVSELLTFLTIVVVYLISRNKRMINYEKL